MILMMVNLLHQMTYGFKEFKTWKRYYNIIKNHNLGYDPQLFTSKNLKNYFSNNNLIPIQGCSWDSARVKPSRGKGD